MFAMCLISYRTLQPGTTRQHTFALSSMAQGQNATFVLAAQCPSRLLTCTATEDSLTFVQQYKARAAPFARLLSVKGSAPAGTLLPFARITQYPNDLVNSSLQGFISDDIQDQRNTQRRGHDDEWYQERCIFCAQCKAAINSTYDKSGSRCHGCRRWFHNICKKHTARNAKPEAVAAATAQTANTAASAGGAGNEQGYIKQHTSRLFLHDDDCKQVYQKLAAEAAAGEQLMPLPIKSSFLPWQQQQSQVIHTWRLLDLTDIKLLYKDAQRRGTLQKQVKKLQQQLHEDAAADSSSIRSDGDREVWPKAAGERGTSSSSKRAVHTRLDDFLLVCEVMKGLGDTPKDLFEDSFAVITKDDRGAALSVGTLNVFGSDHARIQGIATAQHCQQRGHGTRLVEHLESVLQRAGVQQLVAVLEPQDDDNSRDNTGRTPSQAVERWFKKRLGFRPASSEQHMLWRKELPEYHRNLLGGCQLLLKPLKAKSAG